MATITGQSLVDAIQASTGVTLNPLLQATLAARLQQQLDTGTYSPLAAAVAIQGFSTEIKAVVDANGGSTAFSTHLTEVAAAIQNDTPVPEFVPEADQTFALTAGAAAVDEGATATFTLTTTGVAEGTAVAYTLSGIDAADLASGALTGNAVVGADGTATISVVLAADGATEGAETLTVTLDGKTVSATTTVNDTSVLGQTFMLTEALAQADTLPAGYKLSDATVALGELTVDGVAPAQAAAQAIVTGAANAADLTLAATYTLADTLDNLQAADAAVLANAASYSLSETAFSAAALEGQSVAALTGAQAIARADKLAELLSNPVVNGATNATSVTVANGAYKLADTLANLEAADPAVLAGAASYSLTETAFTAAAVASDVAGLAAAQDAAEAAVLTNTVVAGAANAADVIVADGAYTLADTLANLQAADAAVLEGAASYSLINAAGNLGILIPGQKAIVDDAANVADYNYVWFKLEAAAGNTSLEGEGQTYTVTAVDKSGNPVVPPAGTEVKFAITPGNATAGDQGTNTTNLNDFAEGSFNPKTVMFAANATTSTFVVDGVSDDLTELPESYTVTATIVGFETAPLAVTQDLLDGAGVGGGKTFMLTKGLDNYPGTAGNDTIIGSIHATDTELKTLSTLDVVNGGAGVDTLKVATDGTAVGLPNMTNVEIVEVESAGAATVDTSAVAGVTNLNVLKAATAVSAKAAATTDINVSLKQGTAVDNTAPTADVKADIAVTGGKNVTVNVTDVKQVLDVAASGELNGIVVGGAGAAAAAGTVTVTSTGAKTVAATDATLSSIKVTGGSTISVTQKATSDAAAAAADKIGATITQGAVTVTGNASTTTVTVKQDASADKRLADTAVAAKASTQELTFGAMTKDETVSVDFGDGKLIFTANKALTAAEAASAFANLAAGAKQGNASAALGIYTDVVDAGSAGGVTNGWTSGAVTTVSDTAAKVTFTSATAAAPITDGSGTKAITTVGAYSGNAVAAAAAKTGVLGVANGVVSVMDSNDTIKTITVDGYANSTTTATTVLETLNLSNSALQYEGTANGQVKDGGAGGAAASFTVADTAATLALNLEKVGFSGYYDGDTAATTQTAAVTLSDAPTTLNVKSTGNNYVALADTKGQLTTLSVSGTGLLDASTNDLTVLKTIKVTETAGLKLNDAVNDTVESVDTTGTTGTVTVAIKGAMATYAGGAGVDNVTVKDANVAIAKAIDLGAGNDTLTLAGGTILTPTVDLKGGDGVDTLVLDAAQAANTALTANATFSGKIDGFEKLSVGQVAANGDITVNLANIDNISHVISAGAAAGVGGTYDVSTVTFQALQTGQSLTIAGKTVAATQPLTAANVADAMSGATVTGATVTGAFSGWAVKTHTAGATTSVFEATVVGNQPNLSTLITSADATGATLPTATTTTAGSAGTTESAVVTFGSMVAGDVVEVNGLTLTATASTEVATATFTDVTIADGMGGGANTGTIIINGVTVTLTGSNNSSGDKVFTAAEIAAAFATGSTTTAGGGTIGITGSAGALWAASANADTTKVTFTSQVANANVTDLTTIGGTSAGTASITTTTQGNNGQLTAAQVAEAFDGDADGLSTSSAAPVQAAVMSGTNNAAFTPTAIATGSTVTFTSATLTAPVNDISVTGAAVNTTPGVAPATEVANVTFTALKSGQSVTVAGRVVTATGGDLTAAQVEAAYQANATNGFAVVSGGINGWSSADNGTVGDGILTLTSTVANTNVNDLSTVVSVGAAGAPATALTSAEANGAAAVSAAGLLTLDKMANNGTLELTGAATTTTVKMLDATGTTDTFNIVTNAATNTNVGTVVVAKVETLNVTANDTDITTTVNATTGAVTGNVSTNTLALTADAAKTVNLTGAGNLTLTLSADTKAVTLIDGSTATGKLNVTTLASDTAATTVKGGSAADTLVAQGANDVLLGGAGNDILKVVGSIASAVTLTGGDGVDQFDVSGFTAANAGAAPTITDLAKGETIKFVSNANANFASSKVTLIGEATFDNYVTEAAKAADAASAGTHGLAWFQFGGSTFIVQDVDGNASFDNNTDIIVKLTGTVDLSASSFNEVGQGTLLYI